jgi:hypothetical protein
MISTLPGPGEKVNSIRTVSNCRPAASASAVAARTKALSCQEPGGRVQM